MLSRLKDRIYITKGERSLVIAYAAVMAMAAGLAMIVMGSIDPANAAAQMLWVVFCGAVSGAAALFIARGWLGGQGALGIARAIVGCLVIAFLASVIAGTLIRPLYGTFYAPVVVVNALIDNPWLGVTWVGVLFGAHYLFGRYVEEQSLGLGREPRRASAELSRLSQQNLYRRSYRG